MTEPLDTGGPDDVPVPEEHRETEIPMTVGIAGCTFYEGQNAIILCCDWQGTKGSVRSDNMDKTRWVGRATALISGTLTPTDELLNACEATINKFLAETDKENTDLHISQLLADLREVVRLRKRSLMSEFFSLHVGMSYDEFISKGKTSLRGHHYDLLWSGA